MKTKITGFFYAILILFFFAPCNASAQAGSKEEVFVSSTGLLHAVSLKGDFFGTCTVVMFAKNEEKYLFFTNAHCVATFDKKTFKTVPKKADLHIFLENKNGEMTFYDAHILQNKERGMAIGRIGLFEDVAILEAEIDMDIPIAARAETDPELGEEIRIATAPFGPDIGFFLLKGYVSKAKFSKSTTEDGARVVNAAVVQVNGLGKGSGSSGSGVFSIEQNKLVGILVGSTENHYGHISFLVIPITKFNTFYKEYMEGKRLSPNKK